MTGGWRKLRNEELRDLYSSPNRIIQVEEEAMVWAGGVRGVEEGNLYKLLVEKLWGKRSLGRPRNRWVENIKMDLVEIG
jgi:hypothetical protein